MMEKSVHNKLPRLISEPVKIHMKYIMATVKNVESQLDLFCFILKHIFVF